MEDPQRDITVEVLQASPWSHTSSAHVHTLRILIGQCFTSYTNYHFLGVFMKVSYGVCNMCHGAIRVKRLKVTGTSHGLVTMTFNL